MKQKPKIVMVGPDIEGLGGISRVARLWRNGGVFSEHEIKYISSVTDRKVNKVFYLSKSLMSFILMLLQGASFVYIHTSSYNSFRRKSLFLVSTLLLRKKVILHIHPSHFYQYLTNLNDPEKNIVFFLLNRVQAFVVLSEEMRANMLNLLPGKPIHVLRNPVDTKAMQVPDELTRAKNKLLYLGWYIKEKGVYDLVDAIEILRSMDIDINLEFYGTKQIKELQAYVEHKQLQDKISINGWIDGEVKYKALYKATALVLPSYSEGIPNVILEAMATRTPIISTMVGGLKEVLKDKENAIIAKACNPEDLSEKILMCLNDEELRNRIALNAYHEAMTKYDIQIIKNDLSSIVSQLLH